MRPGPLAPAFLPRQMVGAPWCRVYDWALALRFRGRLRASAALRVGRGFSPRALLLHCDVAAMHGDRSMRRGAWAGGRWAGHGRRRPKRSGRGGVARGPEGLHPRREANSRGESCGAGATADASGGGAQGGEGAMFESSIRRRARQLRARVPLWTRRGPLELPPILTPTAQRYGQLRCGCSWRWLLPALLSTCVACVRACVRVCSRGARL